jgi:hypothetical protein
MLFQRNAANTLIVPSLKAAALEHASIVPSS